MRDVLFSEHDSQQVFICRFICCWTVQLTYSTYIQFKFKSVSLKYLVKLDSNILQILHWGALAVWYSAEPSVCRALKDTYLISQDFRGHRSEDYPREKDKLSCITTASFWNIFLSLQRLSSNWKSDLFEVIGYPHHNTNTILIQTQILLIPWKTCRDCFPVNFQRSTVREKISYLCMFTASFWNLTLSLQRRSSNWKSDLFVSTFHKVIHVKSVICKHFSDRLTFSLYQYYYHLSEYYLVAILPL